MKTLSYVAAASAAILHASSSLLFTAAQPPLVPIPPPKPTALVNLLYFNNANAELASEDVPYNACHPSTNPIMTPAYAYITFAPKNATINFYDDDSCQHFAFALQGYYIGFAGNAKSFRWVGWSEDAPGVRVVSAPFPNPTVKDEGDPQGPGTHPDTGPGTGPDQSNHGDSPVISRFIGGVLGVLVVLMFGGLAYWMTIGKRLLSKDDSDRPKKKASLGLGRRKNEGEGDGDSDILLATKYRSDGDHFELGGDEEEEEDEESGSLSSGSREGALEYKQQKSPRNNRHDNHNDDDDDGIREA
ncbi:hypothetical protein BGW38_002647 [Lunasporangiospora selenospora]|uniref:Uncharacterized protein n=1 Tax=Lunasporangiospora selenospora TaxID=979761 RepID=A0A9P6KCR9_9FUNG|nr:hypothetical protein BGW38_002647 [Lunasporangiospora selenospora]